MTNEHDGSSVAVNLLQNREEDLDKASEGQNDNDGSLMDNKDSFDVSPD